jgi:hypothetical protein
MTDRPDHLFVTDAEIRRRLGLSEKQWRRMRRELDKRKPGRRPFPRPVALAGNKRWWPDVYAYFAATAQQNEGQDATSETHQTRRPRVSRPEVARA